MVFREIDPRHYKFRILGVRANNLEATILFVDFFKAFDSIHRRKREQILLFNGLPKETVAAIMILYKNTEVKVRSPDGDTDYFDIVAGVLQGHTLAPYSLSTVETACLGRLLIEWQKKGFNQTKERSRRYPTQKITDAD